MNTLNTEFKASWAFVARNFSLMKRYAGWESVFLIYNVVNTVTIGYIGWGDPDKILYLIIGSLLWGFLSVLFHDVAEAVGGGATTGSAGKALSNTRSWRRSIASPIWLGKACLQHYMLFCDRP